MSKEPPRSAFTAAANDSGAEITTEVAEKSGLVKTGLKLGGRGIAVAGIGFNFKEAYDQVQEGHYAAAVWTAGVRSLPEVATLAISFSANASKIAPIKFAGGPLGYLAIEGVQQLINETTGWVPPSMLVQYSFNADINSMRARDALFPGDGEVEATTRNAAIEDMGIVASPDYGLTPGEMEQVNNIQFPEPELEKLMSRMQNFATFVGKYQKIDEKGNRVPDDALNTLSREMYRLENTGKPEDYQTARGMLRDHLVKELVLRAGEISRERGTNDWDGERVPQAVMNEVAPKVIEALAGDIEGKQSIGSYGVARVKYITDATLYLDPSYNSKETVQGSDGKPYPMLKAAAMALDEYVSKAKTSFDWEKPETQTMLRTTISNQLKEWGFANVPDPERNIRGASATAGPATGAAPIPYGTGP